MLTFLVFLPLILNNYSQPVYDPPIINPNKGIALVEPYLQDLDSVGATWYYTWTHYPKPTDDNRYIPMSYYGLFDASLPVDYDGFVLFLNEPNNPAPFGAGITPQLAAERYRDFIQARPRVKLVVGNASAWSNVWHYDFIHAVKSYGIELPKYVGVHCYVEQHITAEVCEFYINQMRLTWQVEAGYIPEFWITEFADTTGNTKSLTALMNVIQSKSYITRFAYFTNRYDTTQPYIPAGWYDFNLINNDGSLSPMGLIYAQR
jgi:hypothetical protein